MKYKLTGKIIFDNEQHMTVTWIEENLMKQGKDAAGAVAEVPLTVEEVEMHFRSVFLNYMKSKERLSIPTITGYVEIIPFERVFRMSFKVEEYKEGPADVSAD